MSAKPDTAITLSPETSAAIRAAQDALEQEVARAALTNDPLRHYLSAMSTGLGGMHKLFVDGSLTLAQQIENATQHISAAPQPVNDESIRRAVTQGVSIYAGSLAKALVRRNLLLAAGLLVAAVLSGSMIGYWARGKVDTADTRLDAWCAQPKNLTPDQRFCLIQMQKR